jgi:hypothetical protein
MEASTPTESPVARLGRLLGYLAEEADHADPRTLNAAIMARAAFSEVHEMPKFMADRPPATVEAFESSLSSLLLQADAGPAGTAVADAWGSLKAELMGRLPYSDGELVARQVTTFLRRQMEAAGSRFTGDALTGFCEAIRRAEEFTRRLTRGKPAALAAALEEAYGEGFSDAVGAISLRARELDSRETWLKSHNRRFST